MSASVDDEIAKEKRNLDALVVLRIDGEITKEDFSERQLAIKRDISSIESEITRLKTIPQMDGVDVREKMNTLKGALEEQLDFENQGIPDSFIDMFVDEIKVCEGNRCEWRLNLTDLAIGFTTEGSKKKPEIRLEIH